MQQQFTAEKNKGFLWDLMYQNNMFHAIPPHKAAAIKELFDRKIKTISLQILPTDQLVNLNKRVIGEMVNELAPTTAAAATAAVTTDLPHMLYNSSDLLQQRQNKFDMQLKQKQSEFEQLNAKPVPGKIDFTDKTEDTPIGEEMDKILAEQIAWRERQLKLVLQNQDKTTASSWIQTQTTVGNANQMSSSSSPSPSIKLKIGDILKPNKKVSFNTEIIAVEKDETQSLAPIDLLDNFMAALKPKEAEEEIKMLLYEIRTKQDTILDTLLRLLPRPE